MGIKVTKLEGPITPVEFGCCSPVRLGAWVNPEVTEQVYTNNGYPVRLSPEAVNTIRQAYKGTPLRVQIQLPCCDGCRCGGGKCCDCSWPTPVYATFAEYSELWFARQNSESMCKPGASSYIANKCFCHLPFTFSMLCIDTVTIHPSDIKLNTDQELYTFVVNGLQPPGVQRMAVDFYNLPKSTLGKGPM